MIVSELSFQLFCLSCKCIRHCNSHPIPLIDPIGIIKSWWVGIPKALQLTLSHFFKLVDCNLSGLLQKPKVPVRTNITIILAPLVLPRWWVLRLGLRLRLRLRSIVAAIVQPALSHRSGIRITCSKRSVIVVVIDIRRPNIGVRSPPNVRIACPSYVWIWLPSNLWVACLRWWRGWLYCWVLAVIVNSSHSWVVDIWVIGWRSLYILVSSTIILFYWLLFCLLDYLGRRISLAFPDSWLSVA